MVVGECCVLLDNVAYFGLRETVCQDLRLLLDFPHQGTVVVDYFLDFTFQVGPDFFFVLDDKLCLVQLGLQFLDFILQVFPLDQLLGLVIKQHLLTNQRICKCLVPLLAYCS